MDALREVIGPYKVPVEREEAEAVLLRVLEGDDFETRYGSVVAGLREKIKDIVVELVGFLPEEIKSSIIITIRCKNPADEAEKVFCLENQLDDENRAKVLMLREDLCARLKWLIYEQYIGEMAIMANNKLRKRSKSSKFLNWSLSSLDVSNDLKLFRRFWTNNFEAKGSRLFEKLFLPLLDEDLQSLYRGRLFYSEADKTHWEEMTTEEISETLMGLKKSFDPAEREWRWTDLLDWVDENGRPVGKFFVEFWSREIEDGHRDGRFIEMILSELPDDWRKNYKPKSKFRSFRPRETVDFLRGLSGLKSLSTLPWSQGTFQSHGDGEGRRWHDYFYSCYREKIINVFEELLLPLFPEIERRNYIPLGFKFELKDIEGGLELAEREDDLERLHSMVRMDGNRHAFEKLSLHLGSLVEFLLPSDLERVIHRYRPWLEADGIINYALMVSRQRAGWESAAARAAMLAQNVDPRRDEFDGRLEILERLDLGETKIMRLVELLGRGKGLAEIANGDFEPEVKNAAQQVMELL